MLVLASPLYLPCVLSFLMYLWFFTNYFFFIVPYLQYINSTTTSESKYGISNMTTREKKTSALLQGETADIFTRIACNSNML